jgi:hypothetical protein
MSMPSPRRRVGNLLDMTEGIEATAAAAQVRTGVPLVDSILESVEAAADLPPEAQVGVFERAHEQLRRALDAPTDAAPAASEDD